MISPKLIILSGMALSTLTIGACTYSNPIKLENAKYWQRNSASSSLYLRGPKAQQMLHQDISHCTSDIKELQRLGEIRRAIPATYNTGNEQENRTASQEELDTWDTPERDGYLYGEHLEYHDFETCMTSKGWERAEYLPYDEAARARQKYKDQYSKRKKGIGSDREYVTSVNEPALEPGDYPNTND